MIVEPGKMYLFMGQRYAFSGTVELVTPTHVILGADAQVHYEDIGPLEEWARRRRAIGGAVPGQRVCLLGCDVTPVGSL